jgi:hypothetical protein
MHDPVRRKIVFRFKDHHFAANRILRRGSDIPASRAEPFLACFSASSASDQRAVVVVPSDSRPCQVSFSAADLSEQCLPLQHAVGRRIESRREGVDVVRHKTILDKLVLVPRSRPWRLTARCHLGNQGRQPAA